MEELKMDKGFIKIMVILFAIVCLFGFTRVAVIQAGEKSVEEEILDILKEKGVIPHWRYNELKDKAKKEKKGHLFSSKGWNLDIGGALEFEYVDTEKDDGIKNPDGRFQLDKFVLKPKVSSDSHNISLWAELEANEDETKVASFAAVWDKLPLGSRLSTGLMQRFNRPSRKTEVYPLLGTAMWRYEYYQIRWEGKIKPVYWGVSYGEGLRLGTKQVSEDSSYKMLRDNRNTGDKTGHHEWGLKLGVKPKFGKAGRLDIQGYGFWGELSGDATEGDINVLHGKLPNYTSLDDEQSRYGGRITFKYEGLTFMGEMAKLKDGEVERDGWYAQASYKIKTGNKKYLRSVEPLVRYGVLDIDWTKSFAKTASWDREMTTVALITELVKNVKLKAEYYINEEDTGGDDVNNNEFLLQLQYKF
jgi:hypothetical protein